MDVTWIVEELSDVGTALQGAKGIRLSTVGFDPWISHTVVEHATTRPLYRVGQKKVNPKCSTHNFVKYWPIFKILSLL